MATLIVLTLSALALSIERLTYLFAWRQPEKFARWASAAHVADDPVDALERSFYVFKAIQAIVFAGCWVHFSRGEPLAFSPEPLAIAAGLLIVAAGQALNFAAFYRLGRIGIFYGTRFGHDVPWCREFPFSVLQHPQYVGTVMTIWGLFLLVRFPAPDWAILPLLETFYYSLGAVLEQDADAPDPSG